MHLVPVRILVIDDDESVCRKLSAWLTAAAYDVMAFTRPAEALEYARKVFSSIALVDLHLSDADALEVIGNLRKVAPRTRVVVLAAFPEVGQVVAAMRRGVCDILSKPVDEAALLAALERQLREMGVSARSEEEFNRRLGARIRAARSAENLTLQDVADACGLSAAQLSHIELGRTATSTWTLARICMALKTRPAALLEDL